MKPEKQLIAIWGGNGSGKTLFSVLLAQALAKKKRNVVLLSADATAPILPILLPLEKRDERSLGRLWRLPNFSQNDILSNCATFFGSSHFALLGYDLDEMSENYTSEMVEDLMILLRQTVDHIIVDCATVPAQNLLSSLILDGKADIVFKVFNGDLKGLAQIRQLKKHFDETRYFEQINVCNNARSYQDIQPYYDGIGNVPYVLPHMPDLDELYSHGRLSEGMNSKASGMMTKILREVIELVE